MNDRPGRADFFACLLLGVLVGACYASELLGRRSFFFFDVSSLNLPARAWAFRQIEAGYFPEWCTHWYAGFPFVAESQSGVYYPPNYVFFLFLPSWYGTTLAYVAHLWLAGIGAYVLFRRWSSKEGSWLGAAAFAVGGRLLEHQIHAAVVETIAWLPLVLCLILRSVENGDRRALWWAALAAGFQALAGSLQTLVICHLTMFVFLASIVGWNPPGLRRGIGAILVVALSALLLSAALLVPTFELFQQSPRSGGGGGSAWANFGALSPVRWVEFILPGAFGSPAFSTAWLDHREPIFETGLYHGGVVVLLAFVGGFAAGDRRRRAAFAGLALVFVGLSLAAGEMNLVGAGLRKLPIFSGVRVPARYLLLVGLGMCLLAALGWDDLAQRRGNPRGRLMLAALVVVAFAAVALSWMYGSLLRDAPPPINAPRLQEFLSRLRRGMYEVDAPRMLATIAAVAFLLFAARVPPLRWAVFVCLAFDLGWTVRFKYPTIEPAFHAEPKSVETLDRLCDPDPPRAYVRWAINQARKIDLRTDGWRLSMEPYRRIGECLYYERGPLFDVGVFPDRGNLPLQPRRLGDFTAAIADEERLMRVLGISYCMSPTAVHADRVVYRGVGCVIERLPNASPYAMFTNSVERLPTAEVLARLTSPTFDPAVDVVLEGEARAPAVAKRTARALAIWHGPNRLELDIDAASAGVVLVHEMHEDGWTATIDGKPAAIERANWLFMAVPVESGTHRVVLSYAPVSVRWGRWTSSLMLLAWVVVGLRRLTFSPPLPLDRPTLHPWMLVAAFLTVFAASWAILGARWTDAFPTILDPR
jgi:hypothetical protein